MSTRIRSVLEYRSFIYQHLRTTVWITALLYGFAGITLVSSVLFAGEIRSGYVSVSFLVTVVILPYLVAILSFLVQLTTTYADAKSRELHLEAQSRFLSAVEGAITHSAISRTFFTHLLEDWEECMKRLPDGVVTIQKDYWRLSAELFDFAHSRVECTSLVPLVYWDRDHPSANQELLAYKEQQVQKLLKRPKHPVVVSRTFMLHESDLVDALDYQRFFKIVREHLNDGFRVYYVFEKEHGKEAFTALARDFATVDDRIVMLGRFASSDKMVYHYDFFDLSLIREKPSAFLPARSLFSNENEVLAGQPPKLRIQEASGRRRIDGFPALSDPTWQNEKQNIEQIVRVVASTDPAYK